MRERDGGAGSVKSPLFDRIGDSQFGARAQRAIPPAPVSASVTPYLTRRRRTGRGRARRTGRVALVDNRLHLGAANIGLVVQPLGIVGLDLRRPASVDLSRGVFLLRQTLVGENVAEMGALGIARH